MVLTRKLACPSCGVGLKIAESLPAGKLIQCPKCDTGFPVPAVRAVRQPAVAAARKPEPPAEREDEDDEPVEERPRPRKKKFRKKKKPSQAPLYIGLAVGLLLVGGGGAAAFFFFRGDKTEAVADTGPAQPTAAQPSVTPPMMMRRERSDSDAPSSAPVTAAAPAGSGNAPARAASGNFAMGQQVFSQHCARCHPLGNAPEGGRRPRGPDLSTTGRDPKHSVDWLVAFIREPSSQKPNSRMQGFEGKIPPAELREVAQYLASLK